MNRVIHALERCIDDFTVKLNNSNADDIKRHNEFISVLESRYKELESKEIKQWELFSDGKMPETIFNQLNEKVLKEKEDVNDALYKASHSTPEPVDYENKIMKFTDAVEMLKDPNVSAGMKNKYLKEIIEKITYDREKPIQLTKALAKEMGIDYPHKLCWHNYPFKLDITLR